MSNKDYIPGVMPGQKDIEDLYGRNKESTRREFLIGVILAVTILLVALVIAITRGANYEPKLDANDIGWMVFLVILQYIVRFYLVYWVIKDSIERGMSSPPGWGLLVMFFPILGMIFYYIFRTDGEVVECEKCGQKMSEVLHECPRCKYRKETVKKRSWRRQNG